MKRRAVFLCAAVMVMLCANSAFASTACENWKGTWMFNYGGSDNQTVYLNTVCDHDLGCPKMSVFTCYVQGVRADGQQVMVAAAEDMAPNTWGYYETYSPVAMTSYDRIPNAQYTGRFFDNITAPVEGASGSCPPHVSGVDCPAALGSGLTFGRWIDNSTLVPGKCGDWLGRWTFTYFYIATGGNLTDNITDNVTITNVCDNDSTCMDNTTWACEATGKRLSDNRSMFIGKQVGDTFYRYFNDNATVVEAKGPFDPFGQINDKDFFTTAFTADLSLPPDTTVEPTNLISGLRITTTTTTVKGGGGTCADWVGTWTLTYDNSTDTLPGDNNGKGRNGDYEVQICKYTENYIFPSAPTMTFPCFAEGTRTVDGKLIYFIASPFDPVTAYRTYYYELDAYPTGALSNGAVIKPENFAPTAFTPAANTFGLTAGIKTSNDTTNCETPLVCELKIAPKKIFPLLTFLSPIAPFVISAAKDSGIEFTKPIKIDWGTTAINDLIKIRIGKRIIFGLMMRRPLKLESDNYTVTVTYGDNDTQQCGTIEVK